SRLQRDDLGTHAPPAEGNLHISFSARGPLNLQGETVTGRTACVNRARAGPWGSRWVTTGSTRRAIAPGGQRRRSKQQQIDQIRPARRQFPAALALDHQAAARVLPI